MHNFISTLLPTRPYAAATFLQGNSDECEQLHKYIVANITSCCPYSYRVIVIRVHSFISTLLPKRPYAAALIHTGWFWRDCQNSWV